MSSIKLTPEHLRWINERLAAVDPAKILEWSAFTLPQLVQVTSFGPTGMVILDLLHRRGVRLPVIFIDTLHHFPETLEHVEQARRKYDLDLHVYRCREAANRAEFEARFSPDLWKKEPDRYDFLAKVEPQRRALRELDAHAWITGRRRSQGGDRTQMPVLEYDTSGRLKVNPLAYWGYTETWAYLRQNSVPYNALHDKGYKSVGDVMTTTPASEDESERAGRWRGSGKTECGLHLDDIPDPSSQL